MTDAREVKMSGISMEYMGFTSTTRGREYAFHVRFSADDSRDYIVTVALEAFTSRRVSYQDGPNISSSRLKRELTANPNAPTGSSFLIDENEFSDHKVLDLPKVPYRHERKLPND
jgi:hypothetical protein